MRFYRLVTVGINKYCSLLEHDVQFNAHLQCTHRFVWQHTNIYYANIAFSGVKNVCCIGVWNGE
jgi:hypothetical protein